VRSHSFGRFVGVRVGATVLGGIVGASDLSGKVLDRFNCGR